MNIIKNNSIIILFIIFSTISVQAQVKIVEKSSKNKPTWIGTAGKDFFTISASGPTLDNAQNKCMADVKQNIINSIAVNIVSNENSYEQQTTNDKVISMIGSYSSFIKTQGAQLPYLTGISITNATDVYWEKCYVKSENSSYYVYYVKYPFLETERNLLIVEFKKIDNIYNDKLRELQENFDKFVQLESIESAISDLDPLIAYFFDDTRINLAKSLQIKYRKEYENISVVPTTSFLGEFNYSLLLKGRVVTTAKQPAVRANCASNITVRQDANNYRIEYEYGDCLDDEDNWIEFTYQLGGRPLRYKFTFDIKQNKMQVIPQGTVDIEVKNSLDSLNDNILVTLQLRSKYDNEFQVEEVVLSVPGIRNSIRFNELSRKFSGKGVHVVNLESPVSKERISSESILTSGTVRLRNLKTGQIQTISLQLPFKLK